MSQKKQAEKRSGLSLSHLERRLLCALSAAAENVLPHDCCGTCFRSSLQKESTYLALTASSGLSLHRLLTSFLPSPSLLLSH